MLSTPLPVVMTTGSAAVAPVMSRPPTVTPAMPASAETVMEPVTVSPVPSTTLLCAPVTLPSLSSGVMTGGASVWPVTVTVSVAVVLAPSASVTV
ncbi:hypothetical protein AGI3411_05644 [Achromobacter agilis]|uniref:Uncharacterized protein n=1 Tax=Achromobacter agilis TaxID=1353888 RepID=A0A446CXJ2_9BURK|nr:hypothetical protein AGI3411_05644 [Achromobacter agilis]